MLRHRLASAFAALPSLCAVCRSWQGKPLCEACIERFAQPEARCRTCALPVTGGASQCGACVLQPPPLDACYCAVAYAFPWSECIARYKFQQQPGMAAMLAELMLHAPWVEPALEHCDLVLPMPLSPQRLRARGFNQALELARRISPGKTDARLLLRIRDTSPQLALSATERARNVQGAFAVDPLRAHRMQGTDAVLVDDVMTSGASLFAAAGELRQAGADHITAIVLARTDEPDEPSPSQ